MWGCIIFHFQPASFAKVPSLYVRVYRNSVRGCQNARGSLTVCEGISPCLAYFNSWKMFPHYTWGYIAIRRAGIRHNAVPSLYVRVYRYHRQLSATDYGSLIVCEGISMFFVEHERDEQFPHYTWGYIAVVLPDESYINVHSLYVSVCLPAFLTFLVEWRPERRPGQGACKGYNPKNSQKPLHTWCFQHIKYSKNKEKK